MDSSTPMQRYRSVWSIIGMMVIYIVSARIGMLLAVGESNVTILWPPSGLALAAVLLVGPRVLPGIWLGYVVGNSWWLIDTPDSSLKDMGPYFVNAFVVTTQAHVGAVLLKRFAKPFAKVRTLADVLRYLAFAGPISCLVAGLAGPATLVLFGVIPPDAYRSVALTWWIGDTMGVLLLLPLILGFVGKGESRFNPWLYIVSTVLVILGGLVLSGWYLANSELARVHPAFDIMDHKTALAFLLTGAGVVALSAGLRRISRTLGLLLLLLALASLSQYLVRWTFPGDTAFDTVQTIEGLRIDRMALNAALCFLITGFGIAALSGNRPKSYSLFISVSGATIMSLGVVSYMGYILNIPVAFLWGALTRMGVHTALGIIVVGAMFLILSARHYSSYAEQQVRVSFPLGVFLLLMTLTISQALTSEEQRRTDARIEDRLGDYERQIQAALDHRIQSLERMADRWAVSGGADHEAWMADARNHIADFEDFQAIEWVDSDHVIRWVEPTNGNEAAINLNLNPPHASAPLLERAQETGEIQTTRVIDLAQGGKGFVVYCPIGRGEDNQGFIVGVFRLQRFFSNLVAPFTDQFKFTVYEDGDTVFSSGNPEVVIAENFPSRTLSDMGLRNNWVTRLSPLQSYVDSQSSFLPVLMFTGGLVLSILIPMCVYLFFGALHQVDGMRAARSKLASSENRFRALAENNRDVVWTMDTNFKYTYISPSVETFRGVTPEVGMTQTIEEYLTPDSCDRVRYEFATAMQRFATDPDSITDDISIELEMFHADGHRVYGEIRPTLLRDLDGSIIGLQGITRNITDRKESELRQAAILKLALDPHLYTAGLDAAARKITAVAAEVLQCERVGFWLVSPDGATLENVCLYTLSEDRHQKSPALVMGDYPTYVAALKKKRVLVADDVNQSEDFSDLLAGFCRPLRITSMLDAVIRIGGDVRGVVCHEHTGPKRAWSPGEIQFVTEIGAQFSQILNHAQLDKERNRAKALAMKADAANRAKKLFLSNLSHEIRTPMNVIMGYADDLAHDKTLRPEQIDTARRMYESAHHLLNLLSSLIEVSRMETGQIASVESEVNLREICREIVRGHQETCAAKGLRIDMTISVEVPEIVRTDRDKVRQILTNLVDNAVKYTDRGHIGVAFDCGQAAGGCLPITISVTDTGVGIHPEAIDHIFDPFTREDERPALGKGTGLGLSICREYAHALGGSLSVESAVGRGTTFRLEFSVDWHDDRNTISREIAVLRVPPLRPARVLVAEPNRDVARLLADLMNRAEMDVRTVQSSEDVLICCAEWNPEILWLASELSDGPAASIINAVRENESHTGIKICVAVDATAGSESVDLECADAVIKKPFTVSHVYTILEQLVGAEDALSEQTALDADSINSIWDRLQDLPSETLDTMTEALRAIDMSKIRAQLEALALSDRLLAGTIRKHIDMFEFEQVLARIETTRDSDT